MMTLLRIIFATLVLCTLISAAEKETPRSHREILFQLCDSTMHLAASNGLKQFTAIRLVPGNDRSSEYFRMQFVQGLVSCGIPVFINKDSSETTLELSVRESSVLYGEVFTESFLGSRKTERKIFLSVLGNLVSQHDGRVIWSKQFSSSFVDTVDYSETELLQDGSVPLSLYRAPELTFFDKILEPAIVTIASGVAIYLFFTIRS